MNGIVIIDKPQQWTSQDVTARLRRVFSTRRIGHGGTLDPMATGVLPVFVGRATRGVEFFEHAEKTYETVLRLGVTTTTEDIWGQVLTEAPVELSPDQVAAVLPSFRGELQQVPPMYSALKVGGQKLCDLARKGREVPRQSRPITIHELELLAVEGPEVSLRIRCSKGTYIRTLCKDIGQALGCGGCMAALRRTAAGSYTLKQAIPLKELLESAHPEEYLQGVDTLFSHLPRLTLTDNQEKRCRCGNAFSLKAAPGQYRVYSARGEFLMVGKLENGLMTTIKSFFEVDTL